MVYPNQINYKPVIPHNLYDHFQILIGFIYIINIYIKYSDIFNPIFTSRSPTPMPIPPTTPMLSVTCAVNVGKHPRVWIFIAALKGGIKCFGIWNFKISLTVLETRDRFFDTCLFEFETEFLIFDLSFIKGFRLAGEGVSEIIPTPYKIIPGELFF